MTTTKELNLPPYSFEPQLNSQFVIHDPLLAEARMFKQAYQSPHDRRLLEHAQAYADFNAQTTLLEAALPEHISFSQQDYTSRGFEAFGQLLLPMLERGIAAISSKADLDRKGNGYALEQQRRQYELAEQVAIERMAKQELLNNYYVLTLSPYPKGMDEQIAQELGYLPEKQVGKLRLHDYNPQTRKKTIITFSFSEENQRLDRLVNQLTKLVEQNQGNTVNLDSSSSSIAYYLLPKQVGDWPAVYQKLGKGLYDEKNEQLLSKSTNTIDQAGSIAREIVNLDKELAISLLTNKPSQFIKDLAFQLLNPNNSYTQLFTPSDLLMLKGINNGFFNEDVARLIKKIALSNSYLQLAVLTKQPKVARLSLPKDIEPDIFNPSLAQIAWQLLGPMTMSFCGMGFEMYNNPNFYGYHPDFIRGYLFPSVQATKVTTCPQCKKRWLVNYEHGTYGIKCSCGNRVRGGQGAKCIIDAAKIAEYYEKSAFKEAEFVDNRETWD